MSRIGLRTVLLLAFAVVAIFAVSFAAVLTVVLSQRSITTLQQEQRDALTRALAAGAAASYDTGKPGWGDVDLAPVLALASNSDTNARVLDQAGSVVGATSTDGEHSDGVTSPIAIEGRRIGTLVLEFPDGGPAGVIEDLRGSVIAAVIGASTLALLVALAAALIVSRLISSPVTRLTAVARVRAVGGTQARVGQIGRAPAELAVLATTFDLMADSVEEQAQLRRDLVADVAHELRTPLAVLQANIEALQDGVVLNTPDQLASLHGEVALLSRIVDDLQMLAEATASATMLTIQRCDLGTIAGTVADDWEQRFQVADITLDRQLPSVAVDGDSNRLHQVLANLLSNALKYTPAGGTVTIIVSQDEDFARVEVRDTGLGIAPADQAQLFERLWRADGENRPAGTGIGLPIVAELVKAHRGRVEVSSDLGHGSQFVVLIPLAS